MYSRMPKKRKLEKAENRDLEEEERYFLNPDSVSRHLFCSICQDVFREPQRAPCGHSYCKHCIYMWLKQSKTCPEDRRPTQKQDLHYDFILANIIGDQMVACPYRKSGCEFVGKLELLSGHKKSCVFNPTNLPEFITKAAEDKENTPKLSKHGNVICLNDTCDSPCGSHLDSEHLPTPSKPSLMMRLFKNGGSQRELLCSMFDKDNTDDRNRQTASSTTN